MSLDDDECMHGLASGTCSICKAGPRAKSRSGGGGIAGALDTPESLERYRARYSPERQPTFDAYVEVFFRLQGARRFPGGWTSFSRCASAEDAMVRDHPDRVARAEELMRLAGYQADDSGRPARGRRWVRTSG